MAEPRDELSEKRQALISNVKRIVVKIGTAVLTGPDGVVDQSRIRSLSDQVHELRSRGYTVVLVSSGAIGAGIGQLGLRERPVALPKLQAAAAVGQSRLMALYDDAFAAHGYHAAQLLLTREDFDDRARYVNARNTLWALLEMGAVPIFNENDTVAVEEIKVGDNDMLSVLVAHLVRADLLVLLSNVDGLYRAPEGRAGSEELLDVVDGVGDSVFDMASAKKSKLGTGGMKSKLGAVKSALEAGEPVIIARGTERDVLLKIMEGGKTGTLFVPSAPRMRGWKRWISFAARARGHIRVDNGAREAVVERGKSLLPSGIIDVSGTFEKGDVVDIEDEEGRPFARGLTNYSSDDVQAIKGLKTRQIEKALGETDFVEVIHRDNLALSG